VQADIGSRAPARRGQSELLRQPDALQLAGCGSQKNAIRQ
jgi:hypothetical protein